MAKNQHVVTTPSGWGVREEGHDRVIEFKTQKEAIEKARERAMKEKSELIIHGKDGKIRQKNSYGNDPRGRG